MEHAWLDSLSEDWVSQPDHDSSPAPPTSLQESARSEAAQSVRSQGRLPQRKFKTQSSPRNLTSHGAHALNEINANEITSTRHRSTTTSINSKAARVNFASSTTSCATCKSVLHNQPTLQQSGCEAQQETPEWKRRLIQGRFAYGEQRDLFCSTAAALEEIFKPPVDGEMDQQAESTLPSSPPAEPRPAHEDDWGRSASRARVNLPDQSISAAIKADGPCAIKYRLNGNDEQNLSAIDEQVSTRDVSINGEVQQRHVDDRITRSIPHNSDLRPVEASLTSRKTSGQSVVRNEDFSPILIGKHSSEAGKVEFTPVDLPAAELKRKHTNLQADQRLSEHARERTKISGLAGSNARTGLAECNPLLGPIGSQAEFLSQNGGVDKQGSSSEIMVDTSDMLPEESLQASTPKHFPIVGTQTTTESLKSGDRSLPPAPFPSPAKQSLELANDGDTTNSPLKLFGPYDTFTNQTLLRRISQYEDSSNSDAGSSVDLSRKSLLRPQRKTFPAKGLQRDVSFPSCFGGTDLEGFEFLSSSSQKLKKKLTVFRGTPDLLHPDSQSPYCSSRENCFDSGVRWNKDEQCVRNHSSCVESPCTTPERPARRRNRGLAHQRSASGKKPAGSGNMEAKRNRTSPSKDSTPKRRRTLHRSDNAYSDERLKANRAQTHQQMQSVKGRKRKDARPGNFGLADPSVLAMRSILWPRSPATHSKMPPQGSQTDGDVGSMSPDPVKLGSPAAGSARKPSIRTQDFVDQAAQIMAMIRNQVKPCMPSLDESEVQSDAAIPAASLSNSCVDSTNEPLSRPPSREGRLWPTVPQHREDPKLIDRLKKYQEQLEAKDDLLPPVGANEPAATISQSGDVSSSPGATADSNQCGESVENHAIKQATLTTGALHCEAGRIRVVSPSSTSDFFSSRRCPTISSRGSESRRTIMPESVSHLIPERIGSMYLDSRINKWVKRRRSDSASARQRATSEDSEEDPFASIPDLSIDEHLEQQSCQSTNNLRNSNEATANKSETLLQAVPQRAEASGRALKPSDIHAPIDATRQAENKSKGYENPSKYCHSWHAAAQRCQINGLPPSTKRRNLTISFSSPIASIIDDAALKQVHLSSSEEEPWARSKSQDLEREGTDPERENTWAASHCQGSRLVRLSRKNGPPFTSRPVSRIDEREEESTVEIVVNENARDGHVGENTMISQRTPSVRCASLNIIFNGAPDDEDQSFGADESAVIGQNVGRLSLSPLSEFTFHDPDQTFGFEVSYIIDRKHLATGDGSNRVLSMTIRELVGRLSEVEPHEPFWEDITALDLHDKQLQSLHTLDEFCGRVVTLDASRNRLGHLEGIPPTVRQLKASHNMLTELTAWDQLQNLQYLDISGNQMKSLSALKNLVHLRSIRADDNQLTSLDGLDGHDGLMSLRARNCRIETLDFSVISMERLADLDLDGNRICSVAHLESLAGLTRLKLRGNRLRELVMEEGHQSLRQLDVSENLLESLKLRRLPNLRSLNADRNRIQRLSGVEHAPRLDQLSLREQQGEASLEIGFLARGYEIRKLFLSGNYLGTFEPTVDFLNLQLLDLANCGLERLPSRVGQQLPNLRTVNINFNAVADLAPLRFIPRLKKLCAAGNRLADSRASTQLLTEFPHLKEVDLRDNPLTLGFYPPVHLLTRAEDARISDPFLLPDADVARDELFASRLDQTTRLRRRWHHFVFVSACRRLRKLDGLAVERGRVLAKDALLETLIAEELVPALESSLITLSKPKVATERYGAEGHARSVAQEKASASRSEDLASSSRSEGPGTER